jgi:hypothetical protein
VGHTLIVTVRRMRVWTPTAIPFGVVIALLGAWAFFAPLLGPYFQFGFESDEAWQFSERQWELQLIPGIAAFVGGLMLTTPARGWGRLGALLAVAGGAWLLVGPSLYPLWSDDGVGPYGSETMRALRWIGHFYGVGGILVYLAGYEHGLYTRRRRIEDTQIAEPQYERVVREG